MSNRARVWMSVAAVLIVAVVATYLYFGQPSGIGGPSSPTPSSTTAPTPSPSPLDSGIFRPFQSDEILKPGRYWLMGQVYPHPPGWPFQVLVTVPDGWRMTYPQRGGGLHTHDQVAMFHAGPEGAALSGWSVASLYADPCAQTLAEPDLGPSVDDLVSGLASIQSVEVTPPTDTILDGFVGKYLQLIVLNDCGERAPGFRDPLGLWVGTGDASTGEHFDQGSYVDWEHQLWILDVDGLRFVIDAAHAHDAPAELVSELQAMVESIGIERTVPTGTTAPTPTPTPTPVPEFDAPLPQPAFFARPIRFTVINKSDGPAKLLVGEDTSPPERIVGIASPDEVPPHGEALVTFRVPDGGTWAIFVNGQTLILAGDVARCVGRVPIEIYLELGGNLGWGTLVDGSCASLE